MIGRSSVIDPECRSRPGFTIVDRTDKVNVRGLVRIRFALISYVQDTPLVSTDGPVILVTVGPIVNSYVRVSPRLTAVRRPCKVDIGITMTPISPYRTERLIRSNDHRAQFFGANRGVVHPNVRRPCLAAVRGSGEIDVRGLIAVVSQVCPASIDNTYLVNS